MQIYSVQAVKVYRRSSNGSDLTVVAAGLTATTGWTNPRLDGSSDPNPGDAVFEFSFEADRPTGISLQVLTPMSATVTLSPSHPADAVIVRARSNSVTVHASDFIDETATGPGTVTTMMLGEEMSPTPLMGEHWLPTTQLLGEELTTLRVGEEGPWTDPRVDDPFGPVMRPTIGAGEDPRVIRWPGGDPHGGGNPFGGF